MTSTRAAELVWRESWAGRGGEGRGGEEREGEGTESKGMRRWRPGESVRHDAVVLTVLQSVTNPPGTSLGSSGFLCLNLCTRQHSR